MEKSAMQIAIDLFSDDTTPVHDISDVVDECRKLLELEKKQLIEARLDGFKISGEGFNGEYPFEGCLDKKIHEAIDNEQYYANKFNK